MTSTEYRTGITTRRVTFAETDLHTRRVTRIEPRPAGTAICARPARTPGLWNIRIPGTLLTQTVRQGALNITTAA